MADSASYVLGYTPGERQRLIFQATAWREVTEDFLRRAGLGSGMRVLDVGCGVGDVAMIAARQVGEHGSVLAIDRSPETLEVARERAAAAGLANIRFAQWEVDAFTATGTFDAIIGRMILMHLPDPAGTLRRLCSALAPEGIVAFQEGDVAEISQEQPTELGARLVGLFAEVFQRSGVNPRFGGTLPRVFHQAGLPFPQALASQLVWVGPNSPAYEYMEQLVRSLLPMIERFGIASTQELDVDTLVERMRADAMAHRTVWNSQRLVGAWTRLPPA
jgi:ubiquinone/menaquinone biosynthesis C-methylase UbiE